MSKRFFKWHKKKVKRNVVDTSNGYVMPRIKGGNIYQSNSEVLEVIYQTIANEFSKIDFFCKQIQEVDGEKKYNNLENSNINNVLKLRPNRNISAHDFKYIMAYQLVKYGTALAIVHRNDKNEVVGLEPINVDSYFFGNGYETNSGYLFLKVKDKKTGEISLINYDDCLHLRLNANDVFNGEKSSINDEFAITRIIDMQLNTLFDEMASNGSIKGVLKMTTGLISGGINGVLEAEETKREQQKILSERLAQAEQTGVFVIDDGEEWHSFDNGFKKLDSAQLDNMFKYLYAFKGINEKVINGTASYEEMEVFFNKTIMPIIEQMLDEMNYKMLSQTARTQGKIIKYKRDPMEYMSIDKAMNLMYNLGMYYTKNEVREKLGEEELEGGDVLLENLNFKQKGEKDEVKENE